MRKLITDLLAMCRLPLEDTKNYIKWIWHKKDHNHLDQSVLGYPRACMVRVRDDQGTVMLCPIHPVVFFESLASRPGLTDGQMVLGLKAIGDTTQETLHSLGFGEMYFLTVDDKMATLCSRHGWKEVQGFHLMKKKIPPIEVPHDKE